MYSRMTDEAMSKTARQAGLAGIIATVLGAAAILVAGSPPDAAGTIEQLRAYVHAQRNEILVAAVIFQLMVPFLFVFAAGLARVAAGANGEASALAWGGLAGNVGLQAVAVSGLIPFVAAAWRGADDAIVRIAYDGDLLGVYALTAGFSLASVVPVTMAGIMTKTLPRWIALFAFVLAAANVGEIIGLLFYDNGPMALGAGPGLVAVPAWIAWAGAVSVVLLLRAKRNPQ